MHQPLKTKAIPLTMRATLIMFCLFLAAACSQGPDGVDSSYYDDGTGIHWLKGNVELAFELAAAENKPVFLYWGAQWCPPCHQIKATVFKTQQFRERSRLFVPVYLDGDTEDAQRYGEQFGVKGYPTVIVFAPNGDEITRIANGIDIDAFAEVLDLAMTSFQPVAAIARIALAKAPLSSRDCKMFAYYSWNQDNERILATQEPVRLFAAMADRCGAEHEDAARLHLLFLHHSAIAANRDENPLPLSGDDTRRALTRLSMILADPVAVSSNSGILMHYVGEIVSLLTIAESPQRSTLVDAFRAAFDQIAADEEAFATDRLYATGAKVDLSRIDHENTPVQPELAAEILAQTAWVDATITAPQERQSTINAAANILMDAGLNEQARSLLLREIERSNQPYYFMSGLAELAEQEGKPRAALDWLQRAHATSSGPATRFQWGQDYVAGLVKLTPQDADTIETQTLSLFNELRKSPDSAFYHRNFRVMKRLEKNLLEWNVDHEFDEQLKTIRSAVQTMCVTIPKGKTSRGRCDGFLTAV